MILANFGAAVAGFVLSGAYYALLPEPTGNESDVVSDPPAATLVVVELARSGAVACLIGGLVSVGEWTTLAEGALLGAALWTLPVVLLAGSVFHEGTMLRMAVMHAGDWLVKLVAMGLITGWLA